MNKFDHLHLVQSIDSLTGGGLTTSCKQLVEAQLQIGLKSDYISSTSNQELTKKNVIYRSDRFNPFLYTKGMSELLFSQDSNYIHSHGLYMYTSYLAGHFSKSKNVRLMVHVHGMFEPWILQRSKLKKKIVGLLFENYKYKNAAYWRALTGKEADQIKQFGVKGAVYVFPNGIDLKPVDEYLVSNSKENKDERSILFLGRLHEKKGLVPFVKSFLSLPQNVIKGWKLKIVGPDEGIKTELIKIAGENSPVEFYDALYGADKFEMINNSDLFVLPSYSEGFSMAVLEAMSFYKPVMITDACNFEESYEHGAIKLADNPNDWKETLITATSMSKSELDERGRNLRKLVEIKYQWKAIAQDLENTLKDEG